VEKTLTQVHINLGGGVANEFDGIAAVEVFKELGEGVGT
jgi:hypothetical protein